MVVLVGILEALRGAGAAMGEASGLHSSPDARDGPACGVLFSIATWRTTALKDGRPREKTKFHTSSRNRSCQWPSITRPHSARSAASRRAT